MKVVDDPLAGDRIAHLNQSRALFGLEKLDALHVSVEAEEIEQSVAIHLLRVESVKNDDATLTRSSAESLGAVRRERETEHERVNGGTRERE